MEANKLRDEVGNEATAEKKVTPAQIGIDDAKYPDGKGGEGAGRGAEGNEGLGRGGGGQGGMGNGGMQC